QNPFLGECAVAPVWLIVPVHCMLLLTTIVLQWLGSLLAFLGKTGQRLEKILALALTRMYHTLCGNTMAAADRAWLASLRGCPGMCWAGTRPRCRAAWCCCVPRLVSDSAL